MRVPLAFAIIVVLAMSASAWAQGGGQVANKAPSVVEFGNQVGPSASIGALDVVSGVVRDANGEEDIVAIRIIDRRPTDIVFERTITADDVATSTEPDAFTSGWKVWNPTPQDGELSFRMETGYPGARIARWAASVRDEGDWMPGPTRLEVFVPVVGAARDNKSYQASLPPPSADEPLPVSLPPASGIDRIVLQFATPRTDPIDLLASILAERPSGVPAPPATGGLYVFFDLSMEDPSSPGVPIQPTSATIRFRVATAWVDANCASPCVINLMHYPESGGWDQYPATSVGVDGSNSVFEANVTSFSPFAIGGVRPSRPGGGAGSYQTPTPTPTGTETISTTPSIATPTQTTSTLFPLDPLGPDDNTGLLKEEAPEAPGTSKSWIFIAGPLAALALIGVGLHRGLRTRLIGGVQGVAHGLRRRAARRQAARRIPPATVAPVEEPRIENAAPEPTPPSPSPAPPVAPSRQPEPKPLEPAAEPSRTLRVTDLAQRQWDNVQVVAPKKPDGERLAADAPRPSATIQAPVAEDLAGATQRLADAIEASWDQVEVVTPRRLKETEDRENRDEVKTRR